MSKELLDKLQSWYEDDQHDKIAETIEQLPESELDYAIVNHYGRALNNLGRYSEALQQLLSIEEQGRWDPAWHWRIGYAYFLLQQWEEALSAIEQAEKLGSDIETVQEFMEYCRDIMKRQAEAIKEINRVPFRERDFSQFWERSDYANESYIEAPPTAEMIASIEEELGYKLPADYIWLMQQQNGGIPVNTCFPTAIPTSWAEDHIAITGIMGIGREKTYSLCGDLGSGFMLEEWGYPDIGVVICECPSAGHDVIMLDYRACGRDGEPAVVHVDQEADYRITYLAPSFATFIVGLVNEEVFDTSEQDKLDALDKVKNAQFSPLLHSLCEKAEGISQIEAVIRHICTRIVEDKGHFSLHADELSMLMYDIQFWLYTQAYPEVTREQYLADYSDIIVFAKGFSTSGYAPGFITSWLDERIEQGDIANDGGILSLTGAATERLVGKLAAIESDLDDQGANSFEEEL
ncbi:SMI1/KNR4 family protein [Cohnella sp.]|uniref:SMI1/KNR4 family protein n=1 Tax=Cohnella sp. TaxID=1883426 RepID=UPI00356ABA4B